MFVLSFAATAELNSIPGELDNWGTYAFLVLIGALYLFLEGIGLAGWICSRIAGIATSAFAFITTWLTTWGLASVIALFTE